MEARAEIDAEFDAFGSEPLVGFAEGGRGAAFGHEEDAAAWDLMRGDHLEDFGEVGLVGDDEFEEGFGVF